MAKEILNTTSPECLMEYTQDAQGQEVLLKDGSCQVMMEWEKPYMQACIDALKPFGDVLEVGFGCGYSATHIQTYQPKSHTIIEYHPVVAARAREWAKAYPNVTIIEDTWQHALEQLGIYDCIFFDDYPLETLQQTKEMESQAKASSSLLEEGQKVLAHVDNTLPFLKSLQYTEQDMYSFLDMLAGQNASGKQLLRFFSELKERGQITLTLFEEMKTKLIAKGLIEPEAPRTESEMGASLRKPDDRLMQFLSLCLAQHMRKGSRFSCFLSDVAATWGNDNFFNEIISNPYLDYHEQEISVQVPSHCTYYEGNKALVITVQKMF